MAPLNEFIPAAIFGASILGSAHCVGMCGPFTLLFKASRASIVAYHAARGIAYICLGAIGGALGSMLFGSLAFLSLPVVGVLLFSVYFAFLTFQIITNRPWHPPLPQALAQAILPRALSAQSDLARAFTIGLASVFLPCGWLYSFLLGAIATHSAARGALAMGAFWLGTLPALSLTALVGKWLGRERRFSARGRALVFMGMGVLLIVIRLQSPMQNSADSSVFCHDSPAKIFGAFKSMLTSGE